MSDMRVVSRSIAVVGVLVILLGILAVPASAAAPVNDDRGNAAVIGSVPYDDAVDTTEATTQDNDPECDNDAGNNPTVWYSFTPTETRRYRVHTLGSDYDTTLLVARPGTDGLDVIDCNDDFSGVTSSIVWRAVAGQEYLIMAGSCCDSPGGHLEVHVRRAPRPPVVNVTIADSGIVNRLGGAVVRGYVACRRASDASLFVRVKQTAGRFYIRGFGDLELACDRRWRVRVKGDIGRFVPGKVTVNVEAVACNVGGCDTDTERRTVRLVRP
jgi:hypothetical protein